MFPKDKLQSYFKAFAKLDIPPHSSDAEVKKRYKEIVRKNHPDANSDEAATQTFKDSVSAYDRILDFRNEMRKSKIRNIILITGEEAVHGSIRDVVVNERDLCDHCGGIGHKFRECRACKGAGYRNSLLFGGTGCPHCSMIGWEPYENCSACQTRGTVPGPTRNITIEIPSSTWNGRTVHNDDLFLISASIRDEDFSYLPYRDGDTRLISKEVDIPYNILLNGGEFEFKIFSQHVAINVNPRTKPGSEILIQKIGLPLKGGSRGDVLIKVGLLFPERKINDE